MEALLSFLPKALPNPLGCVVHVGAGAAGLSQAATLPVQRLVLIEGEAHVCAELERAARGLAVEILNTVVAPQSGPVTWYRHSPALLDGTLSAEAWRSHYPRLRVVEMQVREAQAFVDLLEPLKLQREPGRSHALLMDVPGQEAGLLASVPRALLDRFDWIVVRGSLPASDPLGEPSTAVAAAMRAACFTAASSAATEAAVDPLWPVTLWRFDPQQRERQLLEDALERLRAECRASEEAREQQEALAHAARASAATFEGELQTLRSRTRDLEAQCRQVQEANLRLMSQVADEQGRRDAAERESASRAASLADAERVLAQRDTELERLASQLTAARAQRDAEMDAAAARLRDVDGLLSQRQAELVARSGQVSAHEAKVAEALSANAALERELKALRVELDAAKAGAAQAAQAAQDAQAREARLQDELSQMTLRQRLLDDEIVKAEGQLELIKDVLLREPSL